jgi:hypothetical protein
MHITASLLLRRSTWLTSHPTTPVPTRRPHPLARHDDPDPAGTCQDELMLVAVSVTPPDPGGSAGDLAAEALRAVPARVERRSAER